MPLYEYVCTKCEARFEELRPTSRMDDAARCPDGHSSGKRVLSTFAAMTAGTNAEVEPVSGGCGGCGDGCTCGRN